MILKLLAIAESAGKWRDIVSVISLRYGSEHVLSIVRNIRVQVRIIERAYVERRIFLNSMYYDEVRQQGLAYPILY